MWILIRVLKKYLKDLMKLVIMSEAHASLFILIIMCRELEISFVIM